MATKTKRKMLVRLPKETWQNKSVTVHKAKSHMLDQVLWGSVEHLSPKRQEKLTHFLKDLDLFDCERLIDELFNIQVEPLGGWVEPLGIEFA